MRSDRAVTFVELIFVIIIIGILIGAVIPQFRGAVDTFQLNSSSRQLQALMIYLQQRAIVESKIVYLNINNDKNQCWVQIKGQEAKIKVCRFPPDIKIEPEQKQIAFYPDGGIDGVTIKLSNRDNQQISLTTKGVFNGVKLLRKE
jgi:type II secretory pathway pseudopilin PulG